MRTSVPEAMNNATSRKQQPRPVCYLLLGLILALTGLSGCQSTSQSSSSQESQQTGSGQSSSSQTPGTASGLPTASSPSQRKPSDESLETEPEDGQSDSGGLDTEAATQQTTEEQIDELDRELDESLAEFDGMILEQQASATTLGLPFDQQMDDADPEAESSGEEESLFEEGDLYEGLPGYGDIPDEERPSDSDHQGGQASGSGADTRGKTGEDAESASSTDAGTGSDAIPADISGGSDDDIVARQLREAAMKEKDPVLRDKLWDEYRKYKNQ